MNWINIHDDLPFKQFDEAVVDEFLVTVYPKDSDPNEEPCVLILWFQAGSKFFSHTPGGKAYEDEHAHFVSHWAELPKPAQIRGNHGKI